MGNKTIKTFGELQFTFTDRFDKRWTDKGSGANRNGGFWHPRPPSGFHALGTMGLELNRYDKRVNGKYACLVVKDIGGRDALARPTGYKKIWDDSGSGADKDGSCWRPKPPTGYVALGDVFVGGYDAPDIDDVMCVRQDLATRGRLGGRIWKDIGSNADDDFGSWPVLVPETFHGNDEKGVFAPNTFAGRKSHNQPKQSDVAWVFYVDIDSDELNDPPPPPQLTELRRPDDESVVVEDRAVLVPFTAVKDDDRDLDWKVEFSPFYQVRRETYYTLQGYQYNDSSIERNDVQVSYTTGVSTTKTNEFHREVGIEVSATTGVSMLGSGGEVSTTVSTQLGWSSSTSVSEFTEETVTISLTAAPWTAVAMWTMSHRLGVYRDDGTKLNTSMSFQANLEYVFDELAIPRE